MNLADNLKRIRKDSNLSQEQLADKLGVSRQSVSKWESGISYPEMDKVVQICKMFNLNIDELLNQDIKEVNEIKQSKSNVNKFIEDFLGFITKTIDMFTSMKFKEKIKCIIEQCIIIGLIWLILLIIGTIFCGIISDIIRFLPDTAYYIIYQIVKDIYIIVSLILGVSLVLHIFKVRYLDYYEIEKIDNNSIEDNTTLYDDENKKEEKDHKEKNVIFLKKKKEKVIIRDPKHSGYNFINGMLKCMLFIVKIFISFVALFFSFTLIGFVMLFILSFMFIKTGLLFIGCILILLSSILINLIILNILYNFIISNKIKKKIIGIGLVISLVLFGIGIGFSLIGVTKFNYIDDINSENYIVSEKVLEMKDNTFIEYYYGDIEYIESNNNDIRIEYTHSKYFDIHFIDDNDGRIDVYFNNNDSVFDFIRDNIKDINNKEIVNYSNTKIKIYTTKENIDKLNNNKTNYYNEVNYYQEEINSLETENDYLRNKNNELIDELCDLGYCEYEY